MNRFAWLLGLVLVFAGCVLTPDDRPFTSQLSPACDACLSGTADTAAHCGSELRTCDEDPICEDYVLCQLRFDCYRSLPNGRCEHTAGCVGPEPADAALAFEECARTTCADVCGFRARD